MQNDFLFLNNVIRCCTFFETADKIIQEIGNAHQIPASFVTGSGSSLIPTANTNTKEGNNNSDDDIAVSSCFSVSMSERKQRDIRAHCGARTLYVRCPSSSSSFYQILFRGANKFFDVQQAFHQIENVEVHFDTTTREEEEEKESIQVQDIIALRKAAGFFCMFFCTNNNNKNYEIECSSKHSLSSEHVNFALDLLKRNVDDETKLKQLGKELFERKLALLCECVENTKNDSEKNNEEEQQDDSTTIATNWKRQVHPVNDADLFLNTIDHEKKMKTTEIGKGGLFCFAIQPLDTVIEWSLSFRQELQQNFVENKFPFLQIVPEIKLSSSSFKCLKKSIFELIRRATTATIYNNNNTELLKGEGAVLLIETVSNNSKNNHTNVDDDDDSMMSLNRPIRLKIKTTQYQVCRQLRSLISGESSNASSFVSENYSSSNNITTTTKTTPLVISMLFWLLNKQQQQQRFLKCHPKTGVPIPFSTWEEIYEEFFSADENNSDTAEKIKIKMLLLKDACLRYRCQMLCPKFLILLCSLPGGGKSSVSNEIKSQLETSTTNHRCHVEIIERDSFVPNLPENSSSHAQRAARKAAHRGFMKALRIGCTHNVGTSSRSTENNNVSSFLLPSCPQVIIADACHASVGARATTRECVAPYRLGITVHLHCADKKQLVLRIMKRGKEKNRVLFFDNNNKNNNNSNDWSNNVEKAIYDVSSVFVSPTQQTEGENEIVIKFVSSAASQTKNPEAIAKEIIEKYLQKGLENFWSDMKNVFEKEEEEEEEEGDKQNPDQLLSFSFLQDHFYPQSKNDISSLGELFHRCSFSSRTNNNSGDNRFISSLLSIQLVPPKSSANSEWKRVLIDEILKKQVFSSQQQNNNNVVAGHTKWIVPYFVGKNNNNNDSSLAECILSKFSFSSSTTCQQQEREQDDEEEIIVDEQEQEKLDATKLSSLFHVTLLHANDFPNRVIPKSAAQEWMKKIQNENSSNSDSKDDVMLFKIIPTHVAIDRRCLVVKVDVECLMSQEKEEENSSTTKTKNNKLLHITVAHSPKVLPSYSIELLKNYFDKNHHDDENETSVFVEEGSRRRQRQEIEKEEEEMIKQQQQQEENGEIKSKNQKRKEVDKQFCIFELVRDENCELFGIVKYLAKK